MGKKFLLMLVTSTLAILPVSAQNSRSYSQNSTDNTTQSTRNNTTSNSEEQQKALKRLDDAAADLNRLTSAGDQGIPDTVLAKAKCVAIIPSLVKAGFVFGGEHGRGVATCRVNKGHWSAPAFFTLTGGSWGAQIGGEAVDLVMFFMDQKGAEQLMSANWKIGGDVGIAAGPWGRQGSASTDWKLDTGILTYSKAKGAFIGATLNGANVSQDKDATKAVYGKQVNSREVLSGNVPPPPQSHRFLASIHRDFHEAQASR